MSVTRPQDGWDQNARKLLLRRILEGSPDKTVDYSPDYNAGRSGYEPGPLTIQITQILRNHAALWARAQRELHGEAMTAEAGKNAWLLQMREADAEIKRFLAGHKLGHGAAA